VEAHAAKTGSARAKALLANWEASKARFWQLVPPAEKVRRAGGRKGGGGCSGYGVASPARGVGFGVNPLPPACWSRVAHCAAERTHTLHRRQTGTPVPKTPKPQPHRPLPHPPPTKPTPPPAPAAQNTPEANPSVEYSPDAASALPVAATA
jgi:glutamate synthase domain-containing protein 3